MHPRIALATYEKTPALAHDDQLLPPALAAAGVDAEAAVWSDESVLWETFDGVVIRSCWDYHLRAGEFRAWLDRLDASRIPVWNAPSLVMWNSHKRYLLDLAQRGVATIQTTIVPRSHGPDVESIVSAEGWSAFVLKPAVSASGFETHLFRMPLQDADRALITRVAQLGDVLVQPFAEEVARNGEYSLTFIDGEFSHATIKRAAGGEFRVQTEHGGSVSRIEAPAAIVAQAKAVLNVLPTKPLYARVDGIDRGDAFLLMELELIEPNLFLELGPGSAERLASALAARLRNA
jgi:glutathione synthase/RimK-type ligase-like ATP-grasp enzyme